MIITPEDAVDMIEEDFVDSIVEQDQNVGGRLDVNGAVVNGYLDLTPSPRHNDLHHSVEARATL